MRAIARGGETPLRRKQLALRVAALELPLRQHHGGPGNLLRARNCLGVFDAVCRRFESAARVLERDFRILRIVPGLELAKSVLKLRGLRAQSRLIGDARSARGPRKRADEPNQEEAGARCARRTELIDT